MIVVPIQAYCGRRCYRRIVVHVEVAREMEWRYDIVCSGKVSSR